MKILNFGSCNIDYVYSLNHVVCTGETEQTHSMNIFPGGKGLNQSIALAKAGAEVYHAGCIGKDGEMLAKLMSDNGIDTSNLKTVDERTGHAVIQVTADGDNAIFVYSGANSAITEDFIDRVLSGFGKDDIIVLQNEINKVDLIIKKAYEKGMCAVFNPSPCNDAINDVDLNFVKYLILNESEAETLTGCGEPELSLKYFKEKYPELKVVLTLGKNGALFSCGSTEIFQPAFCTETVDTTAAGDTFTGYFTANIADGKDYAASLKIAAAAAAIAVSRKGAAPSVPQKTEVLEKLESMAEHGTTRKSEDIKQKIERYTEEHLKQSTINELADILGYSAAYTQTVVKKIYEKPLSKLIQDKCCRKALKMLKETDLPISEIINRIGYENESFFRRMFKRKYGKTMSETRHSTGGKK